LPTYIVYIVLPERK